MSSTKRTASEAVSDTAAISKIARGSAADLSPAEVSKIANLLNGTTLAHVSPSTASDGGAAKRALISASERASVGDVMKILQRENISAVLVRVAEPDAADLEQLAQQLVVPAGTNFLGYVDMLDIMFFLAETYAANKRKHDHVFVPAELEVAFQTPISVFINESRRDPFLAVPASTTLARACTSLFKFGVHRLPLIVDNVVCGNASQSDVVRFLHAHLDELEPLASRSLLELGLVRSAHEHVHEAKAAAAGASDNEDETPAHASVVSVLDNVSVIDALQRMMDESVSGIAITNINGVVVGSFSASDLKGMGPKQLFEVDLKLTDMLEFHHRTRDPVTCTLHDSFRTVVDRVVAARVHRAFVVDGVTKRLTGVVSLTDLISVVAKVAASNE